MEIIKNMMAAICTAIYIRVSTDKQVEKGYSIPEQECKLKALCVAQDLGEHEVYLDDGYSGKDMDRPDLQRLIEDIKSGRIKNIVIYKLDRLSRSLLDTLQLIQYVLIPNGCRLISLTENLDTSTPVGRCVISILSAFAELERETIKERMQMGMIGRAKTGKHRGSGNIPFGYDYDKEKGILVQNADADKVKLLYDMYLQGYGLTKIAEIIGFPSSSYAKQILESKASHGVIHYRGVDYKGQHEPIINEETYLEAMAKRKERTFKSGKETNYLFIGGLLVCGKCGAKMRYQKQSSPNTPAKIMCYSQTTVKHLIKNHNCDNVRHSMIDVEKTVLDELFKISYKTNEISIDSLKDFDILQSLRSQHDDLTKQIKRMYILFSESDSDELLEPINDKKKKLANLQKQIDAEIERNEISNQIVVIQEKIKDFESGWPHWNIERRRDTVRSLIEKIVINDDSIQIHWRFNCFASVMTSIYSNSKNHF